MSIKVVQFSDAKTDVVRVQVQNISKSAFILDRQGFEAPSFQASKDVSVKDSSELKEAHFDSMHLSVGGHWSVAQLQRRGPKRLVTVQPGQTFTAELEVNTLLRDISEEFLHGNIEVTFTFHDFLLAVDGKEVDEVAFKAGIKAGTVTIHRR